MSEKPCWSTNWRVLLCAALLAILLLGGCGITRHAVPQEFSGKAQIPGIPDVRTWGAEFSPLFQADLVESIRQVQAADPQGLVDPSGYVNVLAISGGGANGAYGAGLLCGWTESGTRPTFKLVTGISTGALTAPFAFLGPQYDAVLRKFYTSVSTPDIYTPRPLISVLFGSEALADTTPLAHLIAECVDEKVLEDVAREHRRGRRLYIGTTNLDAGRLVVWNMGAIAASGDPKALDLFRHVMRASASIPVAFPPVLIHVEADGKQYDEMHVDGGATTQVFFYGFMLNIKDAVRDAVGDTVAPSPVRLYVLRNAQIKSHWQAVHPRLLPIATRAAGDLLFTQGVGDLYRIYTIAMRDGIEYRLATIPPGYEATSSEAFSPKDMTRLFDLGFDAAKAGYPWQTLPPGLEQTGQSRAATVTPTPGP